jgi:long-chain acyl-CoA synthetase
MTNAEVRLCVVEDQEQVDKMLEVRESYPALSHIYYDDPRGLRKYDEPGLGSMDELLAVGAQFAKQHPEFYKAQGGHGRTRRRGRHVLHLRHHGQPQRCGAHARHA